MKELEEAEKLLSKSEGHKFMQTKINKQKKVTRDALSFVANINRERSIFTKKKDHEAKESPSKEMDQSISYISEHSID